MSRASVKFERARWIRNHQVTKSHQRLTGSESSFFAFMFRLTSSQQVLDNRNQESSSQAKKIHKAEALLIAMRDQEHQLVSTTGTQLMKRSSWQ